MLKYSLRRFGLALVTVFLACTIIFFAISSAAFADNKRIFTDHAAQEGHFSQYLTYFSRFLSGDMGISGSMPAADIIGKSAAVTLTLTTYTTLLSIFLGLIMGVLSARYKEKLCGRLITIMSNIMIAIPCFVIAAYISRIFLVKLGLGDVWTTEGPDYLLPVICLSAFPAAQICQLTKTAMLDVMTQDYIRAARSRGLSDSRVLLVHGLKNALLPAIGYMGSMVAYIISGCLVVEKQFNMGGLGDRYITAITNRDYNFILGTTIILSFWIIIVNALGDILYRYANPRSERNEK